MYGYIDYKTRNSLNVTNNEWLYMFIIYNEGGYINNKYLSECIGVSIRGIQKIRERLESKSLIYIAKDGRKLLSNRFTDYLNQTVTPKYLCFECGNNAEEEHHVIPRSLGGSNTIPLCKDCHKKAHNISYKKLSK